MRYGHATGCLDFARHDNPLQMNKREKDLWQGIDADAKNALSARDYRTASFAQELAQRDIAVAATLGDAAAVERLLADDPALAASKGGPKMWEPILYACTPIFSSRTAAARENGVQR